MVLFINTNVCAKFQLISYNCSLTAHMTKWLFSDFLCRKFSSLKVQNLVSSLFWKYKHFVPERSFYKFLFLSYREQTHIETEKIICFSLYRTRISKKRKRVNSILESIGQPGVPIDGMMCTEVGESFLRRPSLYFSGDLLLACHDVDKRRSTGTI